MATQIQIIQLLRICRAWRAHKKKKTMAYKKHGISIVYRKPIWLSRVNFIFIEYLTLFYFIIIYGFNWSVSIQNYGRVTFPEKIRVPVVSSSIRNKNGLSALKSMFPPNLFTKLAIVAAYAVLPCSFISIPVFCSTFETCKRSCTAAPRTNCGNDAWRVNIWRIPSCKKMGLGTIEFWSWGVPVFRIYSQLSRSHSIWLCWRT